MTTDREKIKQAREAIADALPDVAAAVGAESSTSPAGDSMKFRPPSDVLRELAAMRNAEAQAANGGMPIIAVPRMHRAG